MYRLRHPLRLGLLLLCIAFGCSVGSLHGYAQTLQETVDFLFNAERLQNREGVHFETSPQANIGAVGDFSHYHVTALPDCRLDIGRVFDGVTDNEMADYNMGNGFNKWRKGGIVQALEVDLKKRLPHDPDFLMEGIGKIEGIKGFITGSYRELTIRVTPHPSNPIWTVTNWTLEKHFVDFESTYVHVYLRLMADRDGRSSTRRRAALEHLFELCPAVKRAF